MGMYTNTGDDEQLARAYSQSMDKYAKGQRTFDRYKKIGSPIMQGVGAALAPFTFGISSLVLGVADTATQAGLAAKNKKLLSKVNDVGFWKSNHVNQVDNSAVDPSGAINGVGTFMSTNMKSAEGKIDAAVKSNQGITQDVNAAPQTYDPATSNPSIGFGTSSNNSLITRANSMTFGQGNQSNIVQPSGEASTSNGTLFRYAKGGGIFSRSSFAKPIEEALKHYSNSLAKGGYAEGGITPKIGTTKSDSIDTHLEEGSFVIPAEQVQNFKAKYGKFFPELYQTASV